MADAWVPDLEGQAQVLAQFVAGFDAFAGIVVERVRQVETSKERFTFKGNVPYRNTITHSTYVGSEVIAGRHLSNIAPETNPMRAIRSFVYTASFLGHMLELTGAKPHDIPKADGTVEHHPGFNRRPHFVPGLLAAASEVGVAMRGKVKVGAIRPLPTRPPVGG